MRSVIASKKLWKDSIGYGLAILGLASSIMTIIGFSLANVDRFCNNNWIARLGALITIYVILVFLVLFIKILRAKNGVSLKIRGIAVNIQQGDIFKMDGWKIIPFNEYFDTTVDDIVIARNTLNGVLIERYIDDIDALNSAISNDNRSPLQGKYVPKKEKFRFPLGCIKIYKDYMLLAFTHFRAYSVIDFSACS